MHSLQHLYLMKTYGTQISEQITKVRNLAADLKLTSELFVVCWDHYRKLPWVEIMQAGEKLLLPCGGKEIFLFLMTRQVHHPGSDVGCYDDLKRGWLKIK